MPKFRYQPTETAFSPAYQPGQEVEATGDEAKALRAHPCFTEVRTSSKSSAKAPARGEEPTREKESEQ